MFKKIIRKIKFAYQRLTRGFDDSELWNLDHTISRFVLPRLKEFKRKYSVRGTPSQIETNEEWQAILDDMIKAFEIMSQSEFPDYDKNKIEQVEKGLQLFVKHFNSLWD